MKIQAGTKGIPIDLNIAPLMQKVAHGPVKKDMIVLHETVSPDYQGFADILSVARYMPSQGLGIHCIVDGEGYIGWALGMRTHLLYHTASNGGNVNTRAIGIEQVSRVMIDKPDNQSRFQWWWQRDKQLESVAKIVAFCSTADGIPLVWSDGTQPGVTTHWQVSRQFNVPNGHTDCWPKHLGGYYPALRVIYRARQLQKQGY